MSGFQFGPLGSGFGHRGKLPGVIGAMDGVHIPIEMPSVDGIRYFNRKGWTSINVLAIVDYKERFTYVHIGEPGQYLNRRPL
jgi:DDE superfamily endonuclease